MRPAVLWGALSAIVLAFPLAAICALVYQFPVPFAGYMSGVAAVPGALFAVVFYGVIGGFPVLAAAGGLAGWAAYRKAQSAQADPRAVPKLEVVYGAIPAVLAVVLLAVLDKLIGAW